MYHHPTYHKLHEACLNGTLESVRELVNSGKFNIDEECGGSLRLTPLGGLVWKVFIEPEFLGSPVVPDHEEKIKFLVMHGADAYKLYGNRYPIIGVILEVGSKNLFNFMLNFIGDLNTRLCFSGNTPLLVAISRRFFKTTKTILVRNADVNMPNYFDVTPLSMAVWIGRTAFVDLLLEYGGGIKGMVYDEYTEPLPDTHVAGFSPFNREVVKKWITPNSLYSRVFADRYPMHTMLAQYKKTGCEAELVVELFLDRGFDLETTDFLHDRTPLMISFCRHLMPIALQLLRNDAHLEITASVLSPDFRKSLLLYISKTDRTDLSLTILKFIALEVSKGIPMNEELRQGLDERQWPSNYLKECYREIDRLKSMEIEDTTITYWKLLTEDIKQIALYIENNVIIQRIGIFELATNPNYRADIIYKLARGKRRLKWTKICRDTLNIMWGWRLPSLFMDMVIDHLTIADMENVKRAGDHICFSSVMKN